MPLLGKDITVGLEKSGQVLRAVCIEHRQDRPRLLALERQHLPSDSPGEILSKSTIGKLIRYGRKTRPVVVNIPGSVVHIKKIQIEASEMDRLQDWVRWEAQQHLPSPLEDYFIDFQKLSSRETGLWDILLVVARVDDIRERAEFFRNAQVKPAIMDADPLALQNIFEANYPSIHDLPVILVNVEEDLTSLVATQAGIPEGMITMHTPSQSQEFSLELEKALGQLESRVRRQGELKQRFETIFLSGGGPHLQEAANYLSSLGEMKVEFADPFRELAIVPNLRETLERQYRPSEFMLATGLALRKI